MASSTSWITTWQYTTNYSMREEESTLSTILSTRETFIPSLLASGYIKFQALACKVSCSECLLAVPWSPSLVPSSTTSAWEMDSMRTLQASRPDQNCALSTLGQRSPSPAAGTGDWGVRTWSLILMWCILTQAGLLEPVLTLTTRDFQLSSLRLSSGRKTVHLPAKYESKCNSLACKVCMKPNSFACRGKIDIHLIHF